MIRKVAGPWKPLILQGRCQLLVSADIFMLWSCGVPANHCLCAQRPYSSKCPSAVRVDLKVAEATHSLVLRPKSQSTVVQELSGPASQLIWFDRWLLL